MRKAELKKIRAGIDQIDERLIALLAERLKLAMKLAELKQKSGMKIRDRERERMVIRRAKERGKGVGLDPYFVEDLMRMVMSRMAGAEEERVGGSRLLERLRNSFKEYPAQLRVALTLFKHGLRVNESGEIACGEIRIPAVQVAREAGVDRRTVDATARKILMDEELRGIFSNLQPLPYLKGVAQQLGMGVTEIIPKDATRPGIVSEVTGIISKSGVSIRQTVTDDPYFVTQPRLTIITDKPIRSEVLQTIRKLPYIESVIIY